jgi:hypothetical protein
MWVTEFFVTLVLWSCGTLGFSNSDVGTDNSGAKMYFIEQLIEFKDHVTKLALVVEQIA